MKKRYLAYYIESAGQPRNGQAEFSNMRMAIRQARAYRANLLPCGGGRAAAAIQQDSCPAMGNYPLEPEIYLWIESAEGGFRAI